MSAAGAGVVLVIATGIYAMVIFLSRAYNRGGRDPVNPFYSVSQWDPSRVELVKTCVVPSFPSNCVIEGMTGAYQEATHWCKVSPTGPCIDPNTGENVKSNPIPFQIVCSEVPYCNWSKCALTFDDVTYLAVTGTAANLQLSSTSDLTESTVFYMERLVVTSQGLTRNQNGTIARFYFQVTGSTDTYLLSYTNNYIPLGPDRDPITALTVQVSSNTAGDLLTMFVLMEEIPTTVAPGIGNPLAGIIAKKILGVGGFNRKSDLTVSEIADFNDHARAKMVGNASKYNLIVIRWHTEIAPAGFYGVPADLYTRVLSGWSQNATSSLIQDVIEYRLAAEPRSKSRAFYNWIA